MAEQREIITTFSEMAPRYESLMNSELNRFWGVNYKEFVSTLLSGISANKDDRILDIATGTAYIPSFLLDNNSHLSGKNFFGLDLTFGMLTSGKERLIKKKYNPQPPLICASAHNMPFCSQTFDQAICCLATHHMDAATLLSNIYFSLKPNGILHIADAGGSSGWKNIFIKGFIKAAAFIYFFVTENISRALAESDAIGNIHTVKEWNELVTGHGFEVISLEKLKSKRFWAPDPLIIKAKKIKERVNDIDIRSY